MREYLHRDDEDTTVEPADALISAVARCHNSATSLQVHAIQSQMLPGHFLLGEGTYLGYFTISKASLAAVELAILLNDAGSPENCVRLF